MGGAASGVVYNALNYMEKAMAPAESAQKAKIIKATWGHLAPTKNRAYKGFIVFCVADYGGDCVIITANFEGLSDSPWLFDAMSDFVFGDTIKSERGVVYRWDGTFKNYNFSGKVTVLYASKS